MRIPVTVVSLFLVSVSVLEVAGQNSWATHLRRSAKRIASVKRSLISRGLAKKATAAISPLKENGATERRSKGPVSGLRPPKKTSSLVAAESGYGYFSNQHKEHEPPARKEYQYTPPVYETGSCYGKPPGMIGNPDYNCKIFHICQADGRFDKMDCPASLRFNNYLGVCDWPNKVDEYCNPVYYYSEKPQREAYNYKPGSGPYVPSSGRDYDMSYAAAERYSTRAKTGEAPRKEGSEYGTDRKKEKEKEYGNDKKGAHHEPELNRRLY